MIVLLASGNASILSLSPVVSARTLSATIASELGEVVFGGGHYRNPVPDRRDPLHHHFNIELDRRSV